ncbi:type II toxin-antitoxin system YafQ family toxin [Zunongwangia sp. F363]|uniref:Type II toxin-antitoxin system YafQ family toxin n=1 Tax=Autumnicola tepida TaxID=3075595 RepID=A0ABU3CBI1_9FLAO|nr:type II toxin-antitoxin system YafQ family toxin [Zunongwangia sp. F363]MDT0643701.1 type II toxin-antitoxin system YafQ family toxin [Zunongwangia sp. F363]
MIYKVHRKNTFKKDLKRCQKRNYNLNLIRTIILRLSEKGNIPAKHNPHLLKGNYKGHWECHIKPDWLLIWLQDDKEKEITLVRTGTHSDLFK